MELRYLRYFIAVAELKNFTRAARQLHVAQPAISQQIKILEEELGVSLLFRNKRKVELTRPGEAFLVEAYAILKRCDDAISLAQRVDRGEVGTLSIGHFSSATSRFMPALIRDYRALFPDVRVTLQDISPSRLLVGLEAGTLDIIFTRALPSKMAARFVENFFYEDELLLALPENHPEAKKPLINLKSLADEDFIFYKRADAPDMVDEMLNCCLRAGFSPRIVSEADLMQSVLTFVESGLGVAIVPGCVRNLQTGSVVFKHMSPKSKKLGLNLVHKKEVNPFVKAMKDLALSHRNRIQELYDTSRMV